MYRDTVQGPVRLFFHHVNDMKTDKRLAVVLRRVSLRPSSVLVGKNGVSRPNTDWLEARAVKPRNATMDQSPAGSPLQF